MSISLPPPRLLVPSNDKTLISQLAQIHADCIHHDHQLATFLPPLDMSRLTDYWNKLIEQVEKGDLAIILQMSPEPRPVGTVASEGSEVAGYVCLAMPAGETGPFRGEVQKLMVSTRFRKIGVARRVVRKLEEVGRERNRTLLTLSTTIGTAADDVYPKLGYTPYGVIPKYGISPKDGRLTDERCYFKDLREAV